MGSVIYLLAGNPNSPSGKPDPIMCAFFKELKATKPHVAYIGTASNDDSAFFDAMRARLLACGAGAVELVPLCGAATDLSAAQHALAYAQAVFVSGGDVAEGMRGLCACEGIIAYLRELFAKGIPFMGLSAGSILLSRGWVNWANENAGIHPDTLFDCLGFAPVYCDVHGEADGWNELKTLVRLLPKKTVAYAIRTGEALRVCDGIAEAIH